MKIVEIIQGSDAWHRFRREHFNASDAAAMLGISPYKTRSALLKEYATGITPEHDAATQKRFERGHELEAAARERAEALIGEDLYPVVGEHEVFHKLSASFDGMTLDGETIWEHKTMNTAIAESDTAPDHIMAQIQQQLLVSGAKKAILSASNTEGNGKSAGIAPSNDWFKRILNGWEQFEKDLADWKPEPEAIPGVTGNAPETLPALRIDLTGKVTASNLPEFRDRALSIIESVNTQLVTDQDFADAEKAVKWCKEAETRLSAAKNAALAQTASIDELFRTVGELSESLRDKRLTLEKLVKTRKEEIRTARVMKAREAFREHCAAAGKEFSERGVTLRLTEDDPDFGGAVKGLKTLDSVDAKLNAALANGKIAVDAAARELREKLAWFDKNAGEHKSKFYDLDALSWKALDDFKNAVQNRIAAIQKEEADRIAAQVEAERERIRKEEAAKAEAEARKTADAERERIRKEELAKIEAEQKAKEASANHPELPDGSTAPVMPEPVHGASDEPPTLKLSAINVRLDPLEITARALSIFGFTATKSGAAMLYRESDFPAICKAIAGHAIKAMRRELED
jgi:putative phage-type endonuclease